MTRYFLCLANSFKHGGRCIAGVELSKDALGNFSVVESQPGCPKWIRPISYSAAGEIPNAIAANIPVLSVIQVDGAVDAPMQAQSENVHYSGLKAIKRFNPWDVELLAKCVDSYHGNLFGNRGKSLHPDSFAVGTYSVMMVKAENVKVKLNNNYGKTQYRAFFVHCGKMYDLPITDPVYLIDLEKRNVSEEEKPIVYLTLSVGVLHDGWHSKLVAAVIEPKSKPVAPAKP